MLNCGTCTGVNTCGGGGTPNVRAAMTLIGCTVTGNTTGSDGGGIYITDGGSVVMTGCTITGNTAVFGGGIYTVLAASSITLNATSVTGNTAAEPGGGGGIYNVDSTVTLQNGSTVTGNSQPNCVGFSDPACGP